MMTRSVQFGSSSFEVEIQGAIANKLDRETAGKYLLRKLRIE